MRKTFLSLVMDSKTNHVGDRFHASLESDLVANGVTVAPKGADVSACRRVSHRQYSEEGRWRRGDRRRSRRGRRHRYQRSQKIRAGEWAQQNLARVPSGAAVYPAIELVQLRNQGTLAPPAAGGGSFQVIHATQSACACFDPCVN